MFKLLLVGCFVIQFVHIFEFFSMKTFKVIIYIYIYIYILDSKKKKKKTSKVQSNHLIIILTFFYHPSILSDCD